MTNAQLILEVLCIHGICLLRVETTIPISDVGVPPCPIVIVVYFFPLNRWMKVFSSTALIIAYVHRISSRVLFTRRVVVVVEATVVPFYVRVTTCTVYLIVWFKRVIAFLHHGRDAKTWHLCVSQAHLIIFDYILFYLQQQKSYLYYTKSIMQTINRHIL